MILYLDVVDDDDDDVVVVDDDADDDDDVAAAANDAAAADDDDDDDDASIVALDAVKDCAAAAAASIVALDADKDRAVADQLAPLVGDSRADLKLITESLPPPNRQLTQPHQRDLASGRAPTYEVEQSHHYRTSQHRREDLVSKSAIYAKKKQERDPFTELRRLQGV